MPVSTPPVLHPRPDLSVGSPSDQGLLVAGDNLLAMQCLAERCAGQVNVAYLDPPYNTGNAFEHYGDKRSTSAWSAMMRPRLDAVHTLLADDGLLFIQIDDNELARLQLMLDDIFGEARRVCTIVVKMSELSGVKMSHVEHRLPKLKEYILVVGRGPASRIRPLRLPKTGPSFDRYLRYYTRWIDNLDNPPERWVLRPVAELLARHRVRTDDTEGRRRVLMQHKDRVVYRTNNRFLASLSFDVPIKRVISPTGIAYIWWEGRQMLFLKDHCEEYVGDLWTDLSTINLNKEGGVRFRNGKKPEALIERVLRLSSVPGDLVLDPFLGSGTTAAVAHKLGRRWIGIEAGPQWQSHALPRLQAVVSGEDQGGISKSINWSGGGGFDVAEVLQS